LAGFSLADGSCEPSSKRYGEVIEMAEKIAVLGAGQMGNGIAHVFAQSGYDVTMIDISSDALEKGKATSIGRSRKERCRRPTRTPSSGA
jgi:3-hydroxybutyryl-CoA dehydrogenase